ncbi:MAG: serine/threonine protein kinase [Planctomycetaceae bacterium]|nr:MAG: serine/threonine protein kinase [Planctomycetaceae bacterium]
MIARVFPCDPEALAKLLADSLPAEEAEVVTRHLDSCSSCCGLLETLAGRAEDWSAARETLAGSGLERADAEQSESTEQKGSLSGLAEIGWVRSLLRPCDDGPGRLGRYPIRGLIGQGGMGVVLQAWDEDLGRPLAIKLLAPHLAGSGTARQRFLREARAAAAIVHPSVVPIYSVTADAPVPYLVMPYIAGGNLQQRIDRDGPLELEECLRIALQISEGLAAAHRQGLIHRDIKPANVLLEPGGHRVLISDFGLARALDDAAMTASGVIAGTPPYMSPEQARGEPLSCRSDLFSLGSVIYAMATGVAPFRGPSPLAVLRQIGERQPKRICEVNERMPPWFDALVDRLMQPQADRRPESAERVAELIGGCLHHTRRPVANRLPTELTHRPVRRRVSPKLASAALVGLIPASALGIYLSTGRPTETPESQAASKPVSEPTAEADSDIPLAFDALNQPLAALADQIEQLHRAVADDLKVEPFTQSEEPENE